MSSATSRHARTVNSTLWAAWADALGFITELTDNAGARRRLGNAPLDVPIAWTRRVGGRFGVPARMPEGCYSDDTQLRLAVSRSISHVGFDAEAFSKVEMTVWPSYALGGGKASRAAAQNLTKGSATWSTNFFEGWTAAGGNGAAMRVQPHVWAARDLPSFQHLDDVIMDSIITHGHPRAIVGAVLHAAALTFALQTGRVPDLPVLRQLLTITRDAFGAFDRHDHLRDFWRPRWEAESRMNLEDAWMRTVDECDNLIGRVAPFLAAADTSQGREQDEVASFYERVCDELQLRDASRRGSGTGTIIAALVLGAAVPHDTRKAVYTAAAAIGTDTDTIATMVGAVLGAANDDRPPTDVIDTPYFLSEADRLYGVAQGKRVPMFPYPDLLKWSPPKSQLHVVGRVDDRPIVAGLGLVHIVGPSFDSKDAVWSWVQTSFGQSLLVKHRADLPDLAAENLPSTPTNQSWPAPREEAHISSTRQASLFDVDDEPARDAAASSGTTLAPEATRPQDPESSLNELMSGVLAGQIDDAALGRALNSLVFGGSLEEVVAFAAALWGAARHRSNG